MVRGAKNTVSKCGTRIAIDVVIDVVINAVSGAVTMQQLQGFACQRGWGMMPRPRTLVEIISKCKSLLSR